jgi:hypothetical protein
VSVERSIERDGLNDGALHVLPFWRLVPASGLLLSWRLVPASGLLLSWLLVPASGLLSCWLFHVL